MREAAGIADCDTDVTVGNVGHVLGRVEVGDVWTDLHQQCFSLVIVRRLLAVGVQAEVLQGQRQDLRGRVEQGDAALLELADVFFLEDQVPAIYRRVGAQGCLDLVRVEADQDGPVHVRHGELVARVVGFDQLHQLGIEVVPVRQLAAVQGLEYAGFDLLGKEHVGRHHHVVAGVAGQQLGFQCFVGVEDVVDQFGLGVLGLEVFQGLGGDVVEPVVDAQGSLFSVGGATEHRGAQRWKNKTLKTFHSSTSSSSAFKTFENVHGIDADFFHGIAAFHDEQRGFAERRDALAHGQVIRAVEFELRDRIILEGIHTQGHDDDIGVVPPDLPARLLQRRAPGVPA
ncbi:hypothetical protein D9M69_480270 [compost metagenome]